MIKAIIFDFDGLIMDTETAWYESFRDAIMSEHGYELTLAVYSTCIGTNDQELYQLLKLNIPDLNRENMENMTEKLVLNKLSAPILRSGVLAYLQEAEKRGLRIGLASSSSRAWVIDFLSKLGILDYFETIVTKEDVTDVKPDPSLYYKALNHLSVSGKETIAFEDSLNGSKAAIAAGIHCVVVPNSVTSHLDFVDHRMRLTSMEDKELGEVIREIEEFMEEYMRGKIADKILKMKLVWNSGYIKRVGRS